MGRGVDILTSQKLNYLETPAAVRPFPAKGMKGHERKKKQEEGGGGKLAVKNEYCCDRTRCRCERRN